MKIAVLSRSPSIHSTKRLVEAATARGHEVRVVDHVRCFMDITSDRPSLHYQDEEFAAEHFDAVIPRIGASVTFYGTAVVRQFEMMGVYSVNESVAITRSRDKLRSLQLLSRRGVGIPVTAFARSPDDVPGLIREVGGAPLVIKLLEGTQGIGVVLAETRTAAKASFRVLWGYPQISWFRNTSRKLAARTFAALWWVVRSSPLCNGQHRTETFARTYTEAGVPPWLNSRQRSDGPPLTRPKSWA